MTKILIPILILTILVFGEYYMWKAIQLVSAERFRWLKWAYLSLNVLLYAMFFSYRLLGPSFPKGSYNKCNGRILPILSSQVNGVSRVLYE